MRRYNKPQPMPSTTPDDICDPVIYVGAAVEAGLDEFNDTAEG